MSKTKKPVVDRAVATTKRSTRTDVEKVQVTHEISAAMPQSSDWATATDLQTLVKAWVADADAIDAQAKVVAGHRADLKTSVAKLLTLRRDWQVSRTQVLSAATALCSGSADRVKALNLDVLTHERRGLLEALSGVTVTPGKFPGDVVVAWARGLAEHGFLVQHATNPADAATISASIPCTRRKLTLSGMPVGANLSCRVAAIDPASPSGMTAWSAWVVGNAR
jgi:hypothetical protein